MADLLETLRATHAHLLEPDDDYLAAAKAERKTGGLGLLGAVGIAAAKIRQKDIPGVKVPDTLFVAVTRRSLILFTPDVVTGRKPKKHVAHAGPALRRDRRDDPRPQQRRRHREVVPVHRGPGSLLGFEVKILPAAIRRRHRPAGGRAPRALQRSTGSPAAGRGRGAPARSPASSPAGPRAGTDGCAAPSTRFHPAVATAPPSRRRRRLRPARMSDDPRQDGDAPRDRRRRCAAPLVTSMAAGGTDPGASDEPVPRRPGAARHRGRRGGTPSHRPRPHPRRRHVPCGVQRRRPRRHHDGNGHVDDHGCTRTLGVGLESAVTAGDAVTFLEGPVPGREAPGWLYDSITGSWRARSPELTVTPSPSGAVWDGEALLGYGLDIASEEPPRPFRYEIPPP